MQALTAACAWLMGWLALSWQGHEPRRMHTCLTKSARDLLRGNHNVMNEALLANILKIAASMFTIPIPFLHFTALNQGPDSRLRSISPCSRVNHVACCPCVFCFAVSHVGGC